MKKVVLMATLSLFARLLVAQEVSIDSLVGEHWYGLYLNGQKAGYMRNEVAKKPDGSVVTSEDAHFRVMMAGMKQDMSVASKRTYGPDGALVQIMTHVEDVSGQSVFRARVEGDAIVIASQVRGQTSERRMPRPNESLKDALKQIQLCRSNARVGDTVEYSQFDPMFGKEIAAKSTIQDIETRFLDGVDTHVFKVETTLPDMGLTSISYITEHGITLEDTMSGMFTVRLEPEAIAKDVDYSNDVIVSNAATVARPIEDPRTRDALRLRIEGPLDEDRLFQSARQRLTKEGDGFVFEGRAVQIDTATVPQLPVTDERVAEWLRPSTLVQSDHPKLIAKAKEIVGDETNALEALKKLTHWVHMNVRTVYSARLSNSLEVLENPEGDCTEYSMLFIGLARAAGIPAREVAGLIYVETPRPGFYFHQWATAWVGEWIDVDPTFDQPLADVTHIKLSEGDLYEQTKLVPVIGQISIEAVE